MKMSNLEPQRTTEIQEEALSKKRKQRKSWKLGRKFKKKWRKCIRKFDEVFEKILGNLGKILRNSEENFKNFKEIYEKMCGSFGENLRKSRENLGNLVETFSNCEENLKTPQTNS